MPNRISLIIAYQNGDFVGSDTVAIHVSQIEEVIKKELKRKDKNLRNNEEIYLSIDGAGILYD